jgi:hypothetical protein
MEDNRNPEPVTLTVPIVAKDLWGHLVRSEVVVPISPSDLGLGEDGLEWPRWAGETLRPEVVDALAQSYQPFLAKTLESDALAHFLREREERLRAEGGTASEAALGPNNDRWVRVVIQWQLEGWIESSRISWPLASIALIWHAVRAWERYERGMGKGSIERFYRTIGLGGAKVDAISSDEFSLATGPFFRDHLVPILVRRFVREAMLPAARSIDEVDEHFGLRLQWDWPDSPEHSRVPA